MKRSELELFGIEKDVIDKIMDIHEVDTETNKSKIVDLQSKLDDANKQISEFGDKVKDLDSKDATVADLQKKIADYEQAEKDKIENETRLTAEKALTDKILETFGDKQFTSDYVKNGLIADIKAQLQNDSTIGIDKAFDTLTKDKAGIFVNPNEPIKIPPAGGQPAKPSEFKSFF